MVRDPRVHVDGPRRSRYEPYPDSKFPDSYDGELVVETTNGRDTLRNRNFADNLDGGHRGEVPATTPLAGPVGAEAGARG